MTMSFPDISPNELLGGAAILAQAAARVRECAYWLCALVDAWYELDGPIFGRLRGLRRMRLALSRQDSENTLGPVAPPPRPARIPGIRAHLQPPPANARPGSRKPGQSARPRLSCSCQP